MSEGRELRSSEIIKAIAVKIGLCKVCYGTGKRDYDTCPRCYGSGNERE